MVRVHLTATCRSPMRPAAMPFADRVEFRLGNAFPAVLVVDRDALPRLAGASWPRGRAALDARPLGDEKGGQ